MQRREFLKTSVGLVGAFFLSRCKSLIDIEEETLNIPQYYYANNYLRSKIDRINALLNADGVIDSFIFITDQHWDFNAKKSPMLMRYIQQNTNIKSVFCGGDFADYLGSQSFNYLSVLKSCWKGDINCVVGNHEYLGSNVTEDRVSLLLDTNSGKQVGNLSRHYYYVDNVKNKIRYVVLSSYSRSLDGGHHACFGYGTDQANWLKEEALRVEKGWKIIIFTHLLYFIGVYDDKITLFDDVNISDIIESYLGPGEIICLFHGHNHRDRIVRMPRSNIPVIITTCDKNVIEKDDQLNIVRQSGSINEQAFDVVIINEKVRLIQCVRIGCPAKDGINDEIGSFVEERIIDY